MTRISISRCATLPAHRGSSSAEKCSTSLSTDIAVLPSLSKGEPGRRENRHDPTDRQIPPARFMRRPCPNGLLDGLKKALAERALNAEMDQHLAGAGVGNSRNGYGRKTVVTD